MTSRVEFRNIEAPPTCLFVIFSEGHTVIVPVENVYCVSEMLVTRTCRSTEVVEEKKNFGGNDGSNVPIFTSKSGGSIVV